MNRWRGWKRVSERPEWCSGRHCTSGAPDSDYTFHSTHSRIHDNILGRPQEKCTIFSLYLQSEVPQVRKPSVNSNNPLRLRAQPKWVSPPHPQFAQPKWVRNLSGFLEHLKCPQNPLQNMQIRGFPHSFGIRFSILRNLSGFLIASKIAECAT